MFEITIQGLSKKQKVLADIIWAFEDYADVKNFIRSLPKKDQADAEGIVELMRLAAIEAAADEILGQDYPEARRVIQQAVDRK